MRFYKYMIEYYVSPCTDEKDTAHGIVIGRNIGDASKRVAKAFVDVERQIEDLRVALLADDDGILVLDAELVKKVADDIIW